MGEKVRLLNPGSVTLSPRVRAALSAPRSMPSRAGVRLCCKRTCGPAWRACTSAEETHAAVLLTGLGTAAVEAMVGSLVPRDGKALVVENGVYGERISSTLQAQGKDYDTVRSDWTEAMDLGAVEDRLRTDGRLTHVVAVHHETTTGRLNDVASLGALCRRVRRGAAAGRREQLRRRVTRLRGLEHRGVRFLGQPVPARGAGC